MLFDFMFFQISCTALRAFYLYICRLQGLKLSVSSYGSGAFTLKGCWNESVQHCGLLCKALAVVLSAAWPSRCPTANKHRRFHHPAVSKGPLDSGYCLVLLCSLPNSFFSFCSPLHRPSVILPDRLPVFKPSVFLLIRSLLA